MYAACNSALFYSFNPQKVCAEANLVESTRKTLLWQSEMLASLATKMHDLLLPQGFHAACLVLAEIEVREQSAKQLCALFVSAGGFVVKLRPRVPRAVTSVTCRVFNSVGHFYA